MARIILQKPRRMWENYFKFIKKELKSSFFDGRRCAKFFLGNISATPVWNSFGACAANSWHDCAHQKKESFDSFSLSLFIHIEGKPYSLFLLYFALFLQLPIGIFIQIREGGIRGIGLINLRDIGTFALRQKLCINRAAAGNKNLLLGVIFQNGRQLCQITIFTRFGRGFLFGKDSSVFRPITSTFPVVFSRKYFMSAEMRCKRSPSLPIPQSASTATIISMFFLLIGNQIATGTRPMDLPYS